MALNAQLNPLTVPQGTANERKKAYMRAYSKAYYARNKERILARNREYFRLINKDPDKRLKRNARQLPKIREWRARNPDKASAAARAWEKSDAGRAYRRRYSAKAKLANTMIAIKGRLRSRIGAALTKNSSTGRRKPLTTQELLGCSIPELKIHLESLFQQGMTWENKHLWHLDHIRPLASFDLFDIDQLKACCHFTNLQPLWREQNLLKSDKIA